MHKIAILLLAAVLAGATACNRNGGNSAGGGGRDEKTLKIILAAGGYGDELAPILKSEMSQQGFTLECVILNDIVQPNTMVNDGFADANSFQHEPYFDQFVKDHGLHNITRGFYTVFGASGLYSRKYKSLNEVPDGATFGIPVDPANNGRALFMLRDHGLLKLRDVDVTHASPRDITDNPHHYKFREVDQLMLQRALEDVDVGFLFSVFALKAGFDPVKDALAREDAHTTPYKGIVAIRKDLVGTPKVKALQHAYASQAVKHFYHRKYGNTLLFLDDLNKS
jgi:D-methionine transport system substrate-binding protein